ncbi:MAG TPA: FkbM family methyltransferase [Pyrinomonadaceae bacterium]
MRNLIPAGLLRTLEWKARFGTVGFRSTAALRAVASRTHRDALVNSRVEQLPPSLRSHLSLVVDVGANTGQWLSSLQKLLSIKRAEIFEPNPEAFKILRSNLGDKPGIRLHQTALGMRSEISTLHVTRTSSLASLLRPSEMLEAQYTAQNASVVSEIEVPVTTLDAVLSEEEAIDLLKIDVQGFERPVLLGGIETLKRTRALLVEMNFVSHYEGDDTFASLTHLITQELGFEFWDMSLPHRGPEGRALWSDAVFINPAMRPAGGWNSTSPLVSGTVK